MLNYIITRDEQGWKVAFILGIITHAEFTPMLIYCRYISSVAKLITLYIRVAVGSRK
jgi:hypothetical protein